MDTKKIIWLSVIVFVVVAAVAWVFLIPGKEDTPEPEQQIPQKEYDLKFMSVGDPEMKTFTTIDGGSTPFLEQGYALVDKNDKAIDPTSVGLLRVKYPGFADFNDANQSGHTEDAVLYFTIWPLMEPGEHVFKIDYKDGKTFEGTALWNQPQSVTAVRTGNVDNSGGEEYKLGDLDLSASDEIYYISPSLVARKIEGMAGSFWLSSADGAEGMHTVLVKHNNLWYIAEIEIGA